ncbi:MAG: hypothetical protein AAFY56_14200, partial [Pseudomonadota bacterium]
VEGGNNVFVLQGGFENAGAAADTLATALTDGGFAEDGDQSGFFVYFNVNLERARLISVEDLDDVDSGIQQVTNLASDANPAQIDELPNFTAANFDFLENGIDGLSDDFGAI